MASLLVVTSDPQSLSAIEQMAEEIGFRTRGVSSAARAEEWLSMQAYDSVLVDSRFPAEVPLRLINVAWKHNPLTIGGIFNPKDKTEGEWEARLSGALVFSGESWLDDIERTLKNLPESSSENDQFGILLVEDLDSPRDIIRAYIEAMGFPRVDAARNGSEALEMLYASPGAYSCIVTDINMPEVKGTELIAELRRNESFRHIPIIVLTAYSSTENLIESLKVGASGFLVKPPRKKALRLELEKARRIAASGQSPRLCQPGEVHLIEEALLRAGIL